MKESGCKSYDELPFLNAATVASVLGAPSSDYELMHESGFPSLWIGNASQFQRAEMRERNTTAITATTARDARKVLPLSITGVSPVESSA